MTETDIERLTSERNDYEAEGRRHIKTIAQLRYDNERLRAALQAARVVVEAEGARATLAIIDAALEPKHLGVDDEGREWVRWP